MLAELGGKAGTLCEPARSGAMKCPLIVRPTSEDVVTGNLFGSLRAINPRWWLPDLLNRALGTERFRQQVYRKLRIEPWQKQPAFPRGLIPWGEGQTEVDVVITWENPATTVYVEMKYGSGLSTKTVHNNGYSGYPADQLIRNARVGLHQCGWYKEDRLFDIPPRDFVLLLVSPRYGNPLVEEYRNPTQLLAAIPRSDRLTGLPNTPFIGETDYAWIAGLLEAKMRLMSKSERTIASQLNEYLRFKLSSIHRAGH